MGREKYELRSTKYGERWIFGGGRCAEACGHDPSPALPKGKGEAFSLVALVAYIHVAVIQETHPRPFPKGRENSPCKVRIVFPNV